MVFESVIKKFFKKSNLKEKAAFIIFILICSTIYFGLGSEDVEAQRRSTNSQKFSVQKACCELTKSGDSCVYTDKNECNKDFKSSLTTCENTNYCSVGTCIYDKDGECFSNTPKSLCEKNNGVWSSDSINEISQCQKGCCQLSNECSFVTQTKCKAETSNFPFVNMIFDKNIENEAQCIDKCRSEERGACVSDDGDCVFTTRNSCIEKSESLVDDNSSKPVVKIGFHPNVLCSNPLLGTNCARQQKTDCFNEKVYWIDSCGNPENIYDSNKDKSYNKGFLLEEEKSCKLNGANDVNCGNCDYSKGTLCGKALDNVNMKFGEFSCNDLSCEQLTTNLASPETQLPGPRETGESWCLYDARVGFGQDVVGSRHYRSLCLNGEEVIEPCKDYREEMCIQGVSGAIKNFNLGQAFKIGEGYLESACRINRYKECNSCNSVGGTCGGECNNLQGDSRVACCRQTCCNNIENKDCFYMPAGITDFGGVCVPMVPPGLIFWESDNSGGGSKDGTQTGAASVCNEGNVACDVKFVRGGTARIGIGGLGTETDWTCVKNCHCLDKPWLIAAATQCKSRGDCGAKYNIKGKFSSSGISEDTDFVLTQKDFEDWSTISRQSLRRDDPTNLGAFFERTWPSFLATFGVGLAAGLISLPGSVAGTFVSAFGSGLVLGPKTLGTYIFGGGTGGGYNTVYAEAFRTPASISDKGVIKTLLDGYEFTNQPETVDLIYQTSADKASQWTVLDSSTKQPLLDGTKKTVTVTDAKAAEAINLGGGLGDFFGVILEVANFLGWLYTIYSLVDVIFKESKTQTFTVTCNPWEAPKGGEDCEKCNEKGKTCSEYRCRSLGTLCRIINEGTEEEKCFAQTPLDVNSPMIKAIKSKDLQIEEKKNQGYTLKTLIKPFTPVELSIETDEPSKCKFDLNTSIKYDDMRFTFGDSLYRYNHTMLFSLPSELQEEQAIKLTNGGKYSLYLRCSDNNGNANNKDYYIKFEIDKGPDLTAPKIELTSLKNNGFVNSELNELGLDIFVNEPSECRWDKNDVDFEKMSDKFICPNSGLQVTPIKEGLYRCGALLKDLKKGKNTFYFRCKDKPTQKDSRNVNKESYKFELTKTEKLNIVSIEPKGKVYRSNPKLSVKTSIGAENGLSVCGYSNNKNTLDLNMPLFLQTNSTEHLQQLRDLKKGNYKYYITCVDRAGNIAKDSVQFDVVTDVSNQPVISQVYKDTKNNLLFVGTNEDSSCQFDNKPFTYGEGIAMTDPNSKRHETNLAINTYYVICKDIFNNEESVTIYP